MKTQLLAILAALGLLAVAMQTAQADILTKGMGGSDTLTKVRSLETKDGISAQFWLVTDEGIFTSWVKNGAIRNLKPVSEVKRNTPVYFALFLANPGIRRSPKPGGKVRPASDVTFDMFLINPSGTICLADKQRTGWKGNPPTPELVYLAKDRGLISFEAIDPLGEYTVVVVIHDNVLKVDMKLTRKLTLTE